MKTFSRLSLFMLVCLGVMLIGKPATAAPPSISGLVTEGPFDVGAQYLLSLKYLKMTFPY